MQSKCNQNANQNSKAEIKFLKHLVKTMGSTDEFTFYTDSKPPAAAIQGLRPQKDNKKMVSC